jgi:hypothetical protein
MLLRTKDRAKGAFVAFQARAEAEAGRRLGILRMDRGGEFTPCAFLDHCIKEGIQQHLTTPFSPKYNGVVERWNQMILDMARNMLKAMKMSDWFWGEAVATTVKRKLWRGFKTKAVGFRLP